jgi:hypothetical protein
LETKILQWSTNNLLFGRETKMQWRNAKSKFPHPTKLEHAIGVHLHQKT